MKTAARSVAVIVALGVAVWFATQARNADRLAAATAILSSPRLPTTAQLGQAERLLDGASLLDPGHGVQVARARLDYEAGRRRDALTILREVLRAEPTNLGGWILLAEVDPNRQTLNQALVEVKQLDPFS